jgi:hypothetical protein
MDTAIIQVGAVQTNELLVNNNSKFSLEWNSDEQHCKIWGQLANSKTEGSTRPLFHLLFPYTQHSTLSNIILISKVYHALHSC